MLGHPASNSIFGFPGNAKSPRLRAVIPTAKTQAWLTRIGPSHLPSSPPTTTTIPLPLQILSKLGFFISLTSLVTILALTLVYAAPTLTTCMSYGERFKRRRKWPAQYLSSYHRARYRRCSFMINHPWLPILVPPTTNVRQFGRFQGLIFYGFGPGSEWNKWQRWKMDMVWWHRMSSIVSMSVAELTWNPSGLSWRHKELGGTLVVPYPGNALPARPFIFCTIPTWHGPIREVLYSSMSSILLTPWLCW